VTVKLIRKYLSIVVICLSFVNKNNAQEVSWNFFFVFCVFYSCCDFFSWYKTICKQSCK